MSMLKGGHVLTSGNFAATVMAARTVVDDGIDVDDPTLAAISDDAESSMVEEEKRNKNGTNDIGIQAFCAALRLGEGYRLIALLLSCDKWGPSYMPHSPLL